jgi:phage FluMu gp28-like protein
VVDLTGDRRPRPGEVPWEVENASNCAVKSRSSSVVSFCLCDLRGVGDGVRAVRRTVEGVIWARARGVACFC